MATDLNLILIINNDKIEKIEYNTDIIININVNINNYKKIVEEIDKSKFSNNIYEIMYDSIRKYKITNYNLNQKRELIKNILINKFINDKENISNLVNNIIIKEFFYDLYERCQDNIEFMNNYNNNTEYIETKNYYENIRRNDTKYNERLNAVRYLYFRLVKQNNLNILANYEEKTLEEIITYIRFYNNKY